MHAFKCEFIGASPSAPGRSAHLERRGVVYGRIDRTGAPIDVGVQQPHHAEDQLAERVCQRGSQQPQLEIQGIDLA